MLERATGFDAGVVEGRFMICARRERRPWIVIVELDPQANLLVVVTMYEVTE
jgi:phage terminase large subunit-like protein